ncbi:hypothetical protein CSC2_29690 [Clostridium zeae]|uniref:Uncharacterized protein n=1 Tax=Clostridium zeae TaxID=2759022 RepID=A0ABQ1ECL6_9CLOT|nr:hypothetical protein CSC2_29690 [Clostridium zeae]
MSRYEAVKFPYIPLGIAVIVTWYGFTDKAKFSLKNHFLRRLFYESNPCPKADQPDFLRA